MMNQTNFVLMPTGATDPFDDPDVVFASKVASLETGPLPSAPVHKSASPAIQPVKPALAAGVVLPLIFAGAAGYVLWRLLK